GWMRLTASMTSTWSRGSASTPPNTAGSFSPYNLASWKASTDAWASLPSASLCSMCASSVPRIRATASSNVWRLAPRSVVSGGHVIMHKPLPTVQLYEGGYILAPTVLQGIGQCGMDRGLLQCLPGLLPEGVEISR